MQPLGMRALILHIADDAPVHTEERMLTFLHASAGGYKRLQAEAVEMAQPDQAKLFTAMSDALASAHRHE
jgi:hypothetical protein